MMMIKAGNTDTECSFSQVQSDTLDKQLILDDPVWSSDISQFMKYFNKSFSVLRLINTLQSSLSDRILNLQILQFVITHQGMIYFTHSIFENMFLQAAHYKRGLQEFLQATPLT